MLKTLSKIAALLSAATFAGSLLAQTLIISPSYENVGLGATKQFIAATNGIQPEGATWAVMSAGGGSIDANGLYTAPTVMPGQGVVTIMATSKGTPTTSNIAYVNLLT